ncbi:MAG: hypothetical protein XE12_1640 [Synergistales bacterium 54_9]|jgi:hypothetical protein|nr:MAG: hypothetical protein XE12_1640 [Synergistales bacterium 54_9]MDN5336488.1 hypothetical protein [Synergistales bacterium]
MAESRKAARTGLFDCGFYFYFSGGQWRYYYASGLSLHGNPLSAPLTLRCFGET